MCILPQKSNNFFDIANIWWQHFSVFLTATIPFFASKQIGIFNANFTTTSFSNCWQIVLTVKELLLALHKTAVFGNMFELDLKLEWVDFCSEKADSN